MTCIQFVNLVQIGQVFWSGGRNGPCRETRKQEWKREQRAAREESKEKRGASAVHLTVSVMVRKDGRLGNTRWDTQEMQHS